MAQKRGTTRDEVTPCRFFSSQRYSTEGKVIPESGWSFQKSILLRLFLQWQVHMVVIWSLWGNSYFYCVLMLAEFVFSNHTLTDHRLKQHDRSKQTWRFICDQTFDMIPRSDWSLVKRCSLCSVLTLVTTFCHIKCATANINLQK